MAVSARDSQFAAMPSALYTPSPQFFRPSQLRKMKGSEQVAAVCFRIGKGGIEFRLVRTRGGRWTFPKGGLESGLTHAQSAALEAFEEAGVHGRMEEACFARYVHRKRGGKRGTAGRRELAVHAHLCEVLWLSRPKESHRKPRWFFPEQTKRRLQQDRVPECAAELIRVVDLAVARIRRMGRGAWGNEALQRVCFEAFDNHTRSAAAATIAVEARSWGVPRRGTPGALNPRGGDLSGERANPPLLEAASPGAE
jgi:8-oxo-dGTP pyrophosphatase MutT (NUDIX family)